MKTLIISDLHGNLPALEKLCNLHPSINNWISLGDNVNYGPWSNECVQFLEQRINCNSLIGNHEKYFLQGFYKGSNKLVKIFFEKCFSTFDEFKILKKYKKNTILDDFYLAHTIKNKYVFHDTELSIDTHSVIGHSHQQYKVKKSGFMLINPGSLGQDRTYINRGNYIIYCSETKEFKLKRFIYDFKYLINEMKSKKYPEECINYYLSKERI